MSWHQLELTLRPEQLEATSALLFELGCAGIEEAVAPSELRSSWEPAVEGAPTQARVLRASFADPDRGAVDAALAATRPLTSAWSELPDVDWSEAWKAQHPPVQLTPRLVVAPPWNAPAGALVIEPGQGFGTGQHPTTGMVARALEELAPGAATLLDVGCGSGVLALAGARLGLRARGVDVQAEAVAEARANAERNGLAVSFSTTPLAELTVGAELVLANVHAEVLVALAPDLIRLSERWLVLGGVLADREAQVTRAFGALEPLAREVEGRWVCLCYRRRVR